MFQKLNEQAMTKMSLTFMIAAFIADEFQKTKWSLFKQAQMCAEGCEGVHL